MSAPCGTGTGSWIPSDEFLADLPRIMRSFAVPGVGIAVVEGGEVVWSRPFGVTNALTLVPIVSRNIVEDASLRKPVFAYLVMQLVDQGPVSYTHLDVYKRQRPPRSACRAKSVSTTRSESTCLV